MKQLLLLFKFALFGSLFILISCKDKDSDPCEDVMCASYEVCNNGVCNCPEGWTGNNCEEEIPSAITLKKIIISNVPSLDDSGDPWDPASNPDLAVALYTGGNYQMWFSGVSNEVDISEEHEFTCDYTFTNNLTAIYKIPITEWDGDDYDLIEIIQFSPYKPGLGYPDTIIAINTAHAKLAFEYSF